MVFKIFTSPLNCAHLHAYMDFSLGSIYKAYAKSAQSQKDERFLIQTMHAGEVPTNM